jgi:hypothetical protein
MSCKTNTLNFEKFYLHWLKYSTFWRIRGHEDEISTNEEHKMVQKYDSERINKLDKTVHGSKLGMYYPPELCT